MTDRKAEPARRIALGAILLLVPMFLLLGLAVYEAVVGWGLGSEAVVGLQGYLAMAVGIGGTLLLTGVLVGLLIYSNRRGFDQ